MVDSKDNMDSECSLVHVSGIPLTTSGLNLEPCAGSLVSVPSLENNLRSVALAVAAKTAVLLQGPVGCGKTTLVEHLAQLTGRQHFPHLIKVQLSDQTDSKLLLGTYCCTEVPGQFVWKPGTLTQAVKLGAWILLEDIDYAPTDVISLLVPLLESRSLFLPSQGTTVTAHQDFQLFATQRMVSSSSGVSKQHVGQTGLLDRLWTKVMVEPLSSTELEKVVVTRWPCLQPITSRMLEVYFLLSSGRHSVDFGLNMNGQNQAESEALFSSHDGRLISTRDFLKWCQRVAQYFELCSPPASAFQDAFDCFCQSIAKPARRIPVAVAIATRFNLLKTKAEFYCTKYKPNIEITNEALVVGRARLRRQESESVFILRPSAPFSFTRPAVALMEQVAVAVQNQEPVLLVGETGTGKTSTVQYLAEHTGSKLVVVNMNQQSDSMDLLGGYKPVELKHIVTPLRDEFEDLFCKSFSRARNDKYLGHVATCFLQHRWKDLFQLLLRPTENALKKFQSGKESNRTLWEKWKVMSTKICKVQSQLKDAENTLAFSFMEGSLVKAVRGGQWLLLDEINLAAPETLECLSGLLETAASSVMLLDKGDLEPVPRHPGFRLFACMNPATDVGKRDLPAGIRNRFTEFFVDELEDENDLHTLVHDYLKGLSITATQVDGIVRLYLSVRKKANQGLVDGTGHKPHYSLRTLCRALSCAAANTCGCVPRSLYESFCLAFLTQLDRVSYPAVEQMIRNQILPKGTAPAVLQQPIPYPSSGNYVQVEGYWLPQGSKEPRPIKKYILTTSVRLNLKNLARIIALGHHPVLLQGETSVGKTSMIQYVAALSGNNCMRINNHEHTDLQEYIGSYAADPTGKLVFKPGVLVDAMRQGHWIILDELNLAPSDVLEALNRVLDDNRELFIAETQELVHAHPQFMLFATQNPPGLYGGRKMLSRAFRNRFIEVHFNELPPKELESILHQRCDVPMSYCQKLVAVMLELQMRRRGSNVFSGKQGFITLRDLFRWGERYRLAPAPPTRLYDWDQHFAEEGYLLLAGRSRRADEEFIIQQVLEKLLKRTVHPDRLFTLNKDTSPVTRHCLEELVVDNIEDFNHIVWTYNLRRLAVLVWKALQFGEPVLLVGETGCGKTSVCQIFSNLARKKLYMVNCHMHSESADFLGGLRPVRHRDREADEQRLFEWVDGPLVTAMNQGCIFLADEISLADDSVLERLNSVLEPEKTLLLAEKGGSDSDHDLQIVARDGFHFLATMNPGGDYGKKELSPALRNRFTEIWCLASCERVDLLHIIKHNVRLHFPLDSVMDYEVKLGMTMLDFLDYLKQDSLGRKCTISIRDILSWVDFINHCTTENHSVDCNEGTLDVGAAYVHGACLVFLDSLGSGATGSLDVSQVGRSKKACLEFLLDQLKLLMGSDVSLEDIALGGIVDPLKLRVISNDFKFGVHPFYINKVFNEDGSAVNVGFELFAAPTTCSNTQRVLRAMQLHKPILLEGSPGVGKTSLVCALAKAAGHHLVRINLSEQTDVSDLFGADYPVTGGSSGQFAWRDGPLLNALRKSYWVVLDEMNLASQSVLEGLNACLDHRGEVYVPELGRTFHVNPKKTRIFACQNPLQQGGARKGLPRSFLNRFTQVFIQPLSNEDLLLIMCNRFSALPKDTLEKMVYFNTQICQEVVQCRQWGQKGAPWEFNLRDLFRWSEIMLTNQIANQLDPGEYVGLIYSDRMRTLIDKQKVLSLYEKVFGKHSIVTSSPRLLVTERCVGVGRIFLPRHSSQLNPADDLCLLTHQLRSLESLIACIQRKWMAILVGPKSSGKTSLVKLLASLTGNDLQVLTMNSAMDAGDLLGGFEQLDPRRKVDELLALGESALKKMIKCSQAQEGQEKWVAVRQRLRSCSNQLGDNVTSDVIDKIRKIVLEIAESQDASLEKEGRDNLAQLEDLLEELQRDVDLGSGACGGHFEWVDSALVKALERGHWMLLDNVNFCSPSVLDRLNALLEPGGVLTIHEQGISGDQVRSVVPHPDFRLILAMDPKNGEISGAMRNRGVEIYLIGEDEGGSFSRQDTHQMLGGIGVTNLGLQELLLGIHAAMQESLPVWEKPGLLELHRSAFFTVKQMSFGVDALTAVGHSAMDTYIQSQKSNSKKLDLICALNSIMSEATTNTSSFSLQLSLPPSLGDFIQDPASATAQSQAVILHALEENNIIYIPDMPDASAYLCSAARIFLQMSSSADLPIRWPIIITSLSNQLSVLADCPYSVASQALRKHLVDPIEAMAVLECLKHKMQELTAGAVALVESKFLPLDIRWHPQLTTLLSCWNSSEGEQLPLLKSLSNKLHLAIVFQLQQACEAVAERHFSKSLQNRSPWQLSWAVAKGQLSSHDLPHPAIVPVFPMLQVLDALISKILGSEQFLLDNQEMYALSEALAWRNRFWVFVTTSVRFIEPHLGVFLSHLALHWMWLKENVLPVVLRTVGQKHKLHHRLSALSASMDSHVSISIQPLHIQAESWRKHIGNVQPFTSKQQANIHQELERFSCIISIWSDSLTKDCLAENCKVMALVHGEEETRVALANAMTQNMLGNEVDGSVKYVQELLRSKGLHGQRGNDDTCSVSILPRVKSAAAHVQLWPLLDHLNMHLEIQMVAKLLCGTLYAGSDFELLKAWEEQTVRCTPSPPSHLTLFMAVKKNLEKGSDTGHHGNAEASLRLYHRLQHCPATSNSLHWLYWNPTCDNGEDPEVPKTLDSAVLSPILMFQSPLQSYCAVHLMLAGCQGTSKFSPDSLDSAISCSVPLNFCQEKVEQMDLLNWIWWRNSAALASDSYSLRKNELKLLASLFRTILVGILQTDPKQSHLNLEYMSTIEDHTSVKSMMNDVQQFSTAILSADDLLDPTAKDLMQHSFDTLQTLADQMFNKGELIEDYLWVYGQAWLRLGMFSVHLLAIFLPFDPAERQARLKNYCFEELTEVERELSVHKWMQAAATGETLENMSPSMVHPHICYKLNKVEILRRRCVDLEKDQAYRPQPSQFNALMIDTQQFVANVASQTTVGRLVKELEAALSDSSLVTMSINRIEAWKKSVNAFLSATPIRYPLYRDLWLPLLAGVTQVATGIDLLAAAVKRSAALNNWRLKATDLHQLLIILAAFPSSKTGLQLAKKLVAPKTTKVVQCILQTGSSSFAHTNQIHDKLLLSGLEEIRNNIITEEELNPDTWDTFLRALKGFLSRWEYQEEEQRRRKAAKEAAYEFRARTYCEEPSEDETDTNYIHKMFPTYSQDFQDFGTMDAAGELVSSPVEEMELQPSNDEGERVTKLAMATVCSMHCQLLTVYTHTPWLITDLPKFCANYRRPFVVRYQVAAEILKAEAHILDSSLDHQLLGGHLVYSTLFKQAVSSSRTQVLHEKLIEAYDIYHDSNVAEVIHCRPVLEKFLSRLTELLLEWPEHPSLRQVQDVIVRILSFPVTDPLMKFVTGLELLLTKAQEWEVNAHKGVSLMTEMEGVSELIIKWRKLELSCWSSCLDNVVYQMETASAKWWFHIFAIVEAFLVEDSNVSSENMTDATVMGTIQQFLENSSVVEFGPRLQIIHAFHCHLVHVKPSVKQGTLLKILWNAFQYYSQFQAAVANRITELRKPIEKEVKEFVKIVRWNDINFWTLKETVEKSHRTVAKHMKRFEKVLNQPVSPFLTDTNLEYAQPIEATANIDTRVYVIPSNLKHCIEESPPSSDILTKLPRLFHRLRKLSRRVVDKSSNRRQTELVDNLTADIITTAHSLQSLEVSKSVPKPKQIAEAKSIHIRKRKALADLFKTLHSVGLSYRKGLLMWNEKNWAQFMDLPMMNIEAALKQLKSLPADDHLARSWQGCLHYLYRSVARMALLRTSCQTPHKDLGLGNLHRVCGIPSHMMFLVQNHHRALSLLEQEYVKLRLVIGDIDKAVSGESSDQWPIPQTSTQVHMRAAKSLYLQSRQIFEQFSILLNCCPRQNTDVWTAASVLPYDGAPGLAMCQGDQEWEAAVALVREACAANTRCLLLLTELCPWLKRPVYVYSQKTVDNLKKVFDELSSIAVLARQLAALFTTSSSSSDFVRGLCLLSDRTTSATEQFRQWSNRFESENTCEEESVSKAVKVCRALTAKLAQRILVAIQDVYKSQVDTTKNAVQSPTPPDGEEDLLLNLFPELCNKFAVMAAQLKLRDISCLLIKTILQLQYVFTLNARTYLKQLCCRSFKSVYPLLAQYLALVQFCVTEGAALYRTLCKLMSVLLGIFNELVQKGFCVPDEYSEDVSGEGATEFQDIEGGGLGEGEGLKDVSDRIEDEDQLDGAQQEGAKEEDDPSQRPDLKEEEHGIEMSEDFDGKCHDLDVEDGSDSSNEDDDDDDEEQLDKQMGDVEEGGEKLDEKVWGSDSEESEGEDNEDENMENGPGDGESSEPQMVAKDDNQAKGWAWRQERYVSKLEESLLRRFESCLRHLNDADTEDVDSKPHSDIEKDVTGNDPVNELDEREYDDNEVDPYHDNKDQEEDSVEPMEVSDDLKLDSGEEQEGEEPNETSKADDEEEMKDDKEEDNAMEDDSTGEKGDDTKQSEEGKDTEEVKGDETAKVGDDNPEQLEKEEEAGAAQENAPCAKPYHSQEPAEPTESTVASEAATDASQPQPQTNTDAADGKQSEEDSTPGMAQEDMAEQGQKGKASLQASAPDLSPGEKQAAQHQHPGQANPKRSLGDAEEKVHNKRLRTVDHSEADRSEPEPAREKTESRFSDVHQHVEKPSVNDVQTRDTATVEQAKEQTVAENEAPVDSETDDVAMNDEKPNEEEITVEEKTASKVISTSHNTTDAHQEEKKTNVFQEPAVVEGEVVATLTSGHTQESTFHTNLGAAMVEEGDGMLDVEVIRAQLEQHLGRWSEWRNSNTADSLNALTAWHQFELMTLPLAQELCEQLRLVLEPSLAAKLRGDYRTGKRLNMRKVIQYVASQFRKDKIWLRRTKPSKRQYQVMLAMDDSSSMADNQVKELAFESLAVVSKALVLLEVGELAVASFGECFHLLHPFHEPFTDVSGAQILRQFTFEQKQTRVGQMLHEAVSVMKGSEKRLRGSVDAAQLLLIISDGRGLFVEGKEAVQQAVRKAQENHVFVVFIVLDLPTNKHSIFDIRLPVYDKEGTGLSFVKSYMDEFPFPFYMVLRDIASLPTVLSDALRQWFELVSAAV